MESFDYHVESLISLLCVDSCVMNGYLTDKGTKNGQQYGLSKRKTDFFGFLLSPIRSIQRESTAIFKKFELEILTDLHVLDLTEIEKHNFGIMSVCEHDYSKTIRATGFTFGWVKDQVGVHGNETENNLAKQGTIEGEIHYLSAPKSHLKNILHRVSINKWQQEWATGDTGRKIYIIPKVTTNPVPWTWELILFATGHGPFPSYLRRFTLHHSNLYPCEEVATPFHYTTTCFRTASYQSLNQVKLSVGEIFLRTSFQD
ncbi:hypothetical protein AVEN_247956-1 [Araneus ventricosus]|uniref:Uncharacterized protein n=1 Tax=Araneus ventricosus TaxID=182803 RepID=A0A4Y2CK03_ARAVE|nr:hypothetical protein AVEN_247956-1 [Araneus ventricosus]